MFQCVGEMGALQMGEAMSALRGGGAIGVSEVGERWGISSRRAGELVGDGRAWFDHVEVWCGMSGLGLVCLCGRERQVGQKCNVGVCMSVEWVLALHVRLCNG